MATIERLSLENDARAANRWDAIATRLREWARDRDIALRDAIVLLPFAQLLPLARTAFAKLGGWQPRIETTRSLGAELGPPASIEAGQLSFDPVVDELQAARLLRSQPWGTAWSRSDARGFAQAAAAVTRTAQALANAAHAVAPGAREAYWTQARAAMAPPAGPGRVEWQLARIALEWASAAPMPASDRLFDLAAPAAWIAVQAGGADPLVDALMTASAAPCAVLDTDPPADAPYADLASTCAPALNLCDDFEHEAQCTAAQVLEHVRQGQTPVALIAQDRVLVRRVRALLERHRVTLSDETGWKLSTTRAAAQVMTLLAAARPEAGTDALLDWLKSGTRWSRPGADTTLATLEADCRRQQIGRIAALARAQMHSSSTRLAERVVEILAPLADVARPALGQWLAALLAALDECGALPLLEADDAGRQVLVQLRRSGPVSDVALSADAFRDWVDRTLEQASFVPSVALAAPADVVITPLARAMLRPFAALVLPGADDRHLGAPGSGDALVGDALAAALGLPTMAARRDAELRAFVHALAVPHVTLMRRRVDGNEPLADSPLVERLALALAGRGSALAAWRDPRIEQPIAPTPIRMSAPSSPDLLPTSLSASAFEALRACPYQFHALRMLHLSEDEELEREVEKRDYGQWLHAVLYDFHRTREAPQAAEIEVVRLQQIAQARRDASSLADAEFLPFAASFASFAPRYVAWLHERDALGARWRDGELRIAAAPPELGGAEMQGVIDRIDDRADGSVDLIDYKTGSVEKLQEKINGARLEDTQLAFYAALMRTQTRAPLTASYLAVDRTRGIKAVSHPNVEESAAVLIAGLARDLERLRAGAGMPALGEGETCDYCAARGICRKDHWSES